MHNRLIKASFWNDRDIVRWSRDKRLFYVGLWQLADDSGCLDDDAFVIRGQIFAFDMDITVEIVQAWLDEICQQNKMLRYVSEGRACLYLMHFRDHQTLDNPTAPEVPLPSWLTWEQYPSNPRKGKYLVSEECLTQALQNPYAPLTNRFQPEPEPEPEIEPEGEINNKALLAASAAPSLVPVEKQDSLAPETEGQRLYCGKFRRKRFATLDQKQAIAEIERRDGFPALEEALTWAAENNIPKISSIRTRAHNIATSNSPPRAGPVLNGKSSNLEQSLVNAKKGVEAAFGGRPSYFGQDTS